MDWMQFVSSLTASLAWPVAAVTTVLLFRKAISDCLPALSKISFPGGSAEFDRTMGEIEAFVEKTPRFSVGPAKGSTDHELAQLDEGAKGEVLRASVAQGVGAGNKE